jgi:hypothetical protein
VVFAVGIALVFYFIDGGQVQNNDDFLASLYFDMTAMELAYRETEL